jgi:small subunit ribosomal protein S1
MDESVSFEELLDRSLAAEKDPDQGTRVTGKVVYITDDSIYCDISTKHDALVPIEECRDENGELTIEVGDTLEALVVSRGQEIVLTTTIGRGAVNKKLLSLAHREGLPVEGKVAATSSGGLTVEVGDIRCFCPHSHIHTRRVTDPESLVGTTMTFNILRYEEGGRNIVLSRKEFLNEQKMQALSSLKETLNEGDRVEGPITSVQDFGIFIDLDGIEALVPRSELSWSRITRPSDYQTGEKLAGIVTSIDWDEERISVSTRALSPDPWESVDRFSPGTTTEGTVTNLIKSGAFVEIADGIEGFIHISRMSMIKRVSKPEEVLSRGDRVTVTIDRIDSENRKIALSLVTDESNPWNSLPDDFRDQTHSVRVEKTVPRGLHVRLSNGLPAFIPAGELLQAGEVEKAYTAGTEILCSVKDFSSGDRKCILSEKGAGRLEEKKELKKYNEQKTPQSSTLGSQFKDTFEKLKKEVDG